LNSRSFVSALVAATIARAPLRLFLEPRHHLRIGPARTIQVFVVLIAILLQPTPHMAFGLVAAEVSSSHLTISMDALAASLSLAQSAQMDRPTGRLLESAAEA
jgi:hypothetical protein